MKNNFTKPFILSLVSIFLIIIVAIISCKKLDDVTSSSTSKSKLMQFYDSKLLESFKNESIAKDFIREINNTPIRIVNDMLSFNSVEDYNKVYDLIITYTNKYDELLVNDSTTYSKYANSTQMPEDIMAFLFESHLNFNSLRMNIEAQLLTLQNGAGIPEDDDPDDHFTVSPYQRALLSPDCEVIVDDLIYVFYDTYYIGIMNKDWRTLRELHQWQQRHNFDELKALEFCSKSKEAFFITTGCIPTIGADFTYIKDSTNPETIQFVNYSCSEAYKEMQYLWNFGDGTTSTEKNPKHTFRPNPRGYIVTLTNTVPNLIGSKGLVQGVVSMPVLIENDDMPNFTYSEGNSGVVNFTCNTHDPLGVQHFEWDFGDGTPIATSLSASITNKYYQNGTFTVKLTVYYDAWTHSDTRTKSIQITKAGGSEGCCVANDREVEKDGPNYQYDGHTLRIKQVMRATNNFLSHRLVAKTKHQKNIGGNNWVAKNADEIDAGYDGYVYWVHETCTTGCGCLSEHLYLWKGIKKNYNQRVLDEGLGYYNPFRVGKKSISAMHYVKNGGVVRIHGKGKAAVHDDPCP